MGSETKKSEKRSPELEKLWVEVNKNQSDFNAWTLLLQHVEQSESDIEETREAFHSFFKRYPYCYGYWKKLADIEKKHVQNNDEEDALNRCEATFERGIEAIPLSVDLWIQYLNFFKTRYKDAENAYERIKAMFDRAVNVCGDEFRSDKLWDLYISWETEQTNLKQVTQIYDRLIQIPTQLYSHHFDKLSVFLEKYPPNETLSDEEFAEYEQQYELSQQETAKKDGAEDSMEEEKEQKADEEPLDKIGYIKKTAIGKRRDIHKLNEKNCTAIWTFEEAIKRPYFHAKPLEKSQLKNWRDYLDFEIERGDQKRVKLLFERCLIACALYEDMWTKYISWLSQFETSENMLSVYRRACCIHLPNKPTINLMWLAYVEKLEAKKELPEGTLEEIMDQVEERFKECILFATRKINVYRRLGRLEKVEELCKNYVYSAPSLKMSNHFALKYARFLEKHRNDLTAAIDVLKEAISREPDNTRLYMTILELAFKHNRMDIVDENIEAAIKCEELSNSKRLEIIQRKLEYLEEHCDDIETVQSALEEYVKMYKVVDKDKDRKRSADDSNGAPDPKKKADYDVTQTAAAYANYKNGTAAAYYAHANQYQWPANTAYSGYSAGAWNGSGSTSGYGANYQY